jgi:hypothetical protein
LRTIFALNAALLQQLRRSQHFHFAQIQAKPLTVQTTFHAQASELTASLNAVAATSKPFELGIGGLRRRSRKFVPDE